ncbi:hypothetical protein GKZ89_15040 [Bacillus mangrovi]|uniref:Glycosyltransferase RgtA/B/C/D-like domain-containing protein n=1 Tax=Metabacillus mangrovi TaxID=1491830 RepID=A0A7X2V5E4_9BACI|nr:hypothetical protein [Metabacillus mangrovi]MTH54717.1 hypothetical protein [Metabacillus mangrovi]
METALQFGLLFLSFAGWGLAAFTVLKMNSAFIPVFLLSAVTVVLFGAGTIHFLPEAAWALYVGGFVALALFLFFAGRGKCALDKKQLLSPGAVFFAVSTIILMILLQGLYFIHYDNFSHWALIVKEMYLMDGLPDDSTVITFQNYPPGTAVFIYYVLKFVGYGESYALMAQGLLVLSGLTALFAFTTWKKPSYIIMTCIAATGLFFLEFHRIYNLLVDFPLAMIAFTPVIIAYYYRTDWKRSIWTTVPILVLLILIKDSGKLFLVINVLFITGMMLSSVWKKEKGWKKTLAPGAAAAVLAGVPILFNLLWGKYTETAYRSSYAENKFAITPSKLFDPEKGSEFIQTLLLKMITTFINWESTGFITFLALSAACVAGLMLFRIYSRSIPRMLIYTFTFLIGAFLLYMTSLYLMYLFLMPEKEAVVLAGFGRYTVTIILYTGAIGMGALLLEWSRIKQPAVKTVSAVIFALLFLTPVYLNYDQTARPELQDTVRAKVKPALERIEEDEKENARILYYSPKSQEDSGYLHFLATYEQLSENHATIKSCSNDVQKKQFRSELKKADYLVIVDHDNSSCLTTASLDADGIYKRDGATFKRLQ